MKKRLVPATTLVAAFLTVAAATSSKNNDPTVMTVNGKDIPLSEFNYLYNKNNTQQVQPQSVDEYADMFVVYKLKVADAEAAGIDTTQAFISEFEKYRDELAQPYLVDKNIEDSLVNEMYQHMLVNRDVNYIMMFGGRSASERAQVKERADSIRTAIINGQGNFADLADQFSVDKNHGHMGYMKANRYPYEFEKAVYETPVGEISEVKEFPFGYFIVRIDDERPDKGQVQVRHILKLTRGLSEEEQLKKKAEADSLLALVKGGADFAELALKHSEDPGSAKKGGMLSWFGEGEMVPEFEAASFAMNDGEVSDLIETAYGYHIINKLGHRSALSLEEARPAILEGMARDSRGEMAAQRCIDLYKASHKAGIDNKVMKNVEKEIEANISNDSILLVKLQNNKKAVAKIGKKNITVAEVANAMPKMKAPVEAADFTQAFTSTANRLLDETARLEMIEKLPFDHEDYKNLINEYRDGMLLFEVSNKNVWERATNDVVGLDNYFKANRAKYTWDKPRYKGYVVFTTNDSIQNLVKSYLDENNFADENLVKELRNKFGKDVKIQKVLSARGENQIIDHIAFDGPAPEKPNKQWPCYFPYRGEIINQPVEAADVKGSVVADYQQMLENEWIDSLKAKYPVTIDRKVLKLVK